MHLGQLDPLRMDFGRGLAGLDSAGNFLGKSIFDPAGVFDKPKQDKSAEIFAMQSAERKERAEREDRERKERAAALVFCPPGSRPNPAFASVPVEARGQALAAGITQCVPEEDAAKKKAAGDCFLIAGSRKYPCTQSGMSAAASHARALAAKGGKPRWVLKVGETEISMARCIIPFPKPGQVPVPGTPVPATPGAPAAAAAAPAAAVLTALPPGQFQCTPGLIAALDAQGRAVCVEASLVQQAQAAAAPRRPGSKRKVRGAKGGRVRKKRALRGLGESPTPEPDLLLRARVIEMQKRLRQLRVVDPKGRPVRVTGRLDLPTVGAVNIYQLAAGRYWPGMRPLTEGEILLGLDTLLMHLQRDIMEKKQMDVLQGACIGCPPRVLLGSPRQVAQANRRYGGPSIPSWMFRMQIPHAKWKGRSVVQANLATQQCPTGYFPTQNGCVAWGAFTSGTGFPQPSTATQVQRSLRPYGLSPTLPRWMLQEQVPPHGMMWASR